jgi:quercetin dioxygenase-like cupin family protein
LPTRAPDLEEDPVADTTIKKVNSARSPKGAMGQVHLASGKAVAMRLWQDEPPADGKQVGARDCETVGYVIAGRTELELEGQTLRLEPDDPWLVPKGAKRTYRILENFTAIEATSPPAQVHGRDE